MSSDLETYDRVYYPLEAYLTSSIKAEYDSSRPCFVIYQDSVTDIFGAAPKLTLILAHKKPLFHEAGVFFPGKDEDRLFVTSNVLRPFQSDVKRIQISLLVRNRSTDSWERSDVAGGCAVMPNGAVNCPDMQSLLICAQGDLHSEGGLIEMNAHSPYDTRLVLTDYHGRRFNSVNDVVYAKDGSIWFTDPNYGFEQGFRPSPELPNQIYRYDDSIHDVRAMADDLLKPNGLCFSPDERTLYVTDTDWIHGDGSTSQTRVSAIYAYSVEVFHGAPFLTNKRLFAMADTGAPDGIKCDILGRVYSGCGDGLNIWGPNGTLLGKIILPGGCCNFCFGRPGELFLLNETRFCVANLGTKIQGALLYGKV